MDRLLSLFCDPGRPEMPILNKQARYLDEAGRGILKYFSPKFGELCSPDMETFGPFGGKFLGGETSIDQMKQIQGIRGILHQLKLVAF